MSALAQKAHCLLIKAKEDLGAHCPPHMGNDPIREITPSEKEVQARFDGRVVAPNLLART